MSDKKDLQSSQSGPDAGSSFVRIGGRRLSDRSQAARSHRHGRSEGTAYFRARRHHEPPADVGSRLPAAGRNVRDGRRRGRPRSVQLVYFRGFDECRASRWVVEPRALTDLMTRIGCRGGHTQIGRVLRHVRNETANASVKALVYVGDAMEEPIDDLCAVGRRAWAVSASRRSCSTKAPIRSRREPFSEDRAAHRAAPTRGFDASAPHSLAGLLRAAAAYASGGRRRAGAARLARNRALASCSPPLRPPIMSRAVLRRRRGRARLVAVASISRARARPRSPERCKIGRRPRWRSAARCSCFCAGASTWPSCSAAPRPGSSAGAAFRFPACGSRTAKHGGLGVPRPLRHDRDGARPRHRRHEWDRSGRPHRGTRR